MSIPHPRRLSTLLILAGIFLQGCNLLPTRLARLSPEMPPAAQQSSETEQLLSYVLQARLLTPAEFGLEKDRVRAELATEKSSRNRIKLAILIAFSAPLTTVSGTQEETELLSLIEPLAFSPGASPSSAEPGIRAIATLLQNMAQDRRRLREVVARSQTSRREEANAQAEARILRMQLEDLEKKLNALKSIERSVTSRSAEGSAK